MEGIYFFFRTYILFRKKVYTFHAKTLYFPSKRYILFGQKVCTFLVKSIYFFQKEIMILYISDIQPIMFFLYNTTFSGGSATWKDGSR